MILRFPSPIERKCQVRSYERKTGKPSIYYLKHEQLYEDVLGAELAAALEHLDVSDCREAG